MANIGATALAPAPAPAPVPAPARPTTNVIPIVVHVVDKRPEGSPGKSGFCMREVFQLEGLEYMMVLNSVRDIGLACGLDMMKPISLQNKTSFERFMKSFLDFAHHNNPQWPVEAFIMVVLKNTKDRCDAIQANKSCARTVAASPNTKARPAKRRAAEAHIDVVLGPPGAVDQAPQEFDDMSVNYDNYPNQGMDDECGPVLGDLVLNHTLPSTHEPAQRYVPVPARATPAAASYTRPSVAALARPPPPIPPAATRPRPCPRQAESFLVPASMSTPAPTSTQAPTSTPAATSTPAPVPTPAPMPTLAPGPTLTAMPTPTATPVPTPMSAPPSPAPVDSALVPVATSTPVWATTSTLNPAALAAVPPTVRTRISSMLLSLGFPEVDSTFADTVGDSLANLSLDEPEVVGKGKGKARGRHRTKAQATVETLLAEPSTSTQPAARAPRCKKVVEVPPTAPAARTRSRQKTAV
ncbi:hypothetical protein FRC06_011282 [Ceratobasidium sp. 370]|nr:hypothetical protein FRC06_011282 [Ceratobasidium sp. 370]